MLVVTALATATRRSPARASILVVDDEPTIAEVVSRYLRRSGYVVRDVATGTAAIAAIEAHRPDLVILDLMLPGIDGLEVMRRLRRAEGGGPAVMMLTARGEESDRIVGLRLGADDYVVKPFSPGELVARVDAILRRTQLGRDSAAVIESGELRIDPAARTVTRSGGAILLTQREFDLLVYFAQRPGQVLTRDELMDRVWQYAFYTDTSTVTVHMRRLRAKIEPDPARPRYLETVWGVGYRFRA